MNQKKQKNFAKKLIFNNNFINNWKFFMRSTDTAEIKFITDVL